MYIYIYMCMYTYNDWKFLRHRTTPAPEAPPPARAERSGPPCRAVSPGSIYPDPAQIQKVDPPSGVHILMGSIYICIGREREREREREIYIYIAIAIAIAIAMEI